MKMKRSIFVALLIFGFSVTVFPQVNKYLRKAARSTENGYLEKARQYYLKAISIDKDNYKANVGLGITLSEFMDKYEEALPFLENAYGHTPSDTLPDLLYALAKCYQHTGKFNEAISFIEKLKNSAPIDEEENKSYQLDLLKRKEDCVYAMANTGNKSDNDWYVINLGSTINSSTPEYVPVLTPENELLFTSRRKDTEKEKINDLDGKYFESMYISKLENGRFSEPRRYTIPDLFLNSKFRKHHESIISMTPDGKKIFVYRDNKIYEIELSEVKKAAPRKLSKNINFDAYQNHAYLSKDGKLLFFTSEAAGGFGGLDIYKSEKGTDGNWSKPVNLGPTINTPYDEDAPFLSNDGTTLYFASRGLPGYGNFDIYKSTITDGKWGQPENLGMPINSQAHDIFMIQNKDGNIGYFSSARPGGKGDMDIYKINYLKDYNKECITDESPLLSIQTGTISENEKKYSFTASLPGYLKVLQYEWKVNGNVLREHFNYVETTFNDAGNQNIKLKVIAYCDTCFEPMVLCNIAKLDVSSTGSVQTVATTYSGSVNAALASLNNYKGKLNNEQLSALGFNLNPMRFNFDSKEIRDDAKSVLDKNIEILVSHPELKVEIYGYADTQGKKGYNQALSAARARNIKNYMVEKGLKHNQIIIVVGKGSTNLLNDCVRGEDCDKEHNEMNRRVEFSVIKK